jgi:aspartate aminotransferase
MEFAIAQSFSKNFGLYGERIGVLHVVALDPKAAANTTLLLTQLSRAEITSCPSYGARIVAEILGAPILFKQWLKDLVEMSERMKNMRLSMYQGLERRKVRGSWKHLLSDVSLVIQRMQQCVNTLQIAMFSMTGLSRAQVAELREKHHIYLLPSGRLSVTGCKYLALCLGFWFLTFSQ